MSFSGITEPAWIQAHLHSSRHRVEVLSSELCGCFYCIRVFVPTEIQDWLNEPPRNAGTPEVEQTALCPHCGIDSVIGSGSGFPVTCEFLQQMQDYWF